MILLFSLLGGWISRMHGGGWPRIPYSPDAWLYALPYGAIAFFAANIWWAIPAYLIAVMGKRTGHGNFMSLDHYKGATHGDERLEFIIKPLRPHLSPYWYDALGLALTGSVVALGTGIVLAPTAPILAAVLVLCGAGKALAYMVGWKVSVDKPTEIGEFLTGVFGWASCYYILQALQGVHFG